MYKDTLPAVYTVGYFFIGNSRQKFIPYKCIKLERVTPAVSHELPSSEQQELHIVLHQ